MYAPGQLADTKKVLIDIGTGYYVEKVILVYSIILKFNFQFVF